MSMKSVTELAYGKINLYLDVVGRRENGYHDIQSVMQHVSLHDTVTVVEAEQVTMTCSDPTLTCGEDNLCIRAARTFLAAYGKGGCGISLNKALPRQAGMGGGSADGAAVLRALNRLYGSPFTTAELCAMGARFGADVPFCVQGRGAALAEGIGERLSPFPSLPPCHLVLVESDHKVETPKAYALLDTIPSTERGDLGALAAAMQAGDLRAIGGSLYNRFEDAVPSSRAVFRRLLALGACGARMTGSGATVFGLFIAGTVAETACRALCDEGYIATTATPIP